MTAWNGVITHPLPHHDENVALLLLRDFGDMKYPGISRAIKNRSVVFLREDEFEKSVSEYEKDGWLVIGVGGGELDEHAAGGEGRKEGECAATLVARKLGIDKLPELKKILEYALAADLGNFNTLYSPEMEPFRKANPKLFQQLVSDISMLRGVDPDTSVKLIHEKNPDDPWVAINWDFETIEAKFAEQYEFHVVAPKEAEKATSENVGKLKVTVVESESPEVETFLRSNKGGRSSVVIKKSPKKGQVQVFTNKQLGISLSKAIALLRLLEIKANRRKDTPDFDELTREGTIESVPEWNYFKKAEMLLNGCHTAPHTVATKIPLKIISSAIRLVLLRDRTEQELRAFVNNFQPRS